MGWTEYFALHTDNNGKVDTKAECDSMFKNNIEILKSAVRGNVYYAAIRDRNNTDSKVWCEIIITSHKTQYGNFAYKSFSEYCNPYYYDCPKSILQLLTPTNDEYANAWRKGCKEKSLAEKRTKELSSLPIGSCIIWTRRNSEKIKLTKHAAGYQFKTPFWMTENGKYVQKKLIKNWEIQA